jgi:iron complex outermembrane receptor protein
MVSDYRIDSSLNWFWRDKVSFDAAGNPLMTQVAYGLLNANIGVGPDNDKWRLSFFARNILDKHFVNRVTGQGVYGGAGISVQWPSPDAERLLGVALDVKFGGS